MRREWSAIIKNRQWSEFEAMAKSDPSQELADTVAELERGIDDKPDRRALRKVLYTLAQAGYAPQDIAEPSAPTPEPDESVFGYMVSPDATGTTGFIYGIGRAGRARYLTAAVRNGIGITEASERTIPVEEADAFWTKYLLRLGSTARSSAVPGDYARSRIAAALREQKGRAPLSVAYWRSGLLESPILPHPTLSVPTPDCTPAQRRSASYLNEAAMGWMLDAAAVMPALQELVESQSSGIVLTDAQKKERQATILAKGRAEALTPDVVADHALRLRDLAYLSGLNDDPDADILLAAAVDLEERGADSDYAGGLFDKTIAVTIERWKASTPGAAPAMRRVETE